MKRRQEDTHPQPISLDHRILLSEAPVPFLTAAIILSQSAEG
jgi:hypothetical protein